MNTTKDLFPEFPPVSKSDWLAKLEKELKGKSFSDLRWQLDDDIILDPFYHPEDFSTLPDPLLQKADNDWEIGEYVFVEDFKLANRQALEALQHGVNALYFQIGHEPGLQDLQQLLQGIEPAYLSTHFALNYTGRDPKKFFHLLQDLWSDRPELTQTVRGSIEFDPLQASTDLSLRELAHYLQVAEKALPNFSVLQVDTRSYHRKPEDTSRELALAIAKGNAYLAQLGRHGVAPAVVNRNLEFSVAVSTSYFVEIAKLRALRSLWSNVLAAYGLPDASPATIVVHLTQESQGEDPNTNRIKATTQAMSAVIGGADRLYIPPADAVGKESGSPASYRLARNVQHILKMESFMDQVVDPAAGSYYIEKMTDALAEAAWKQFQEIEAEGGLGNLRI